MYIRVICTCVRLIQILFPRNSFTRLNRKEEEEEKIGKKQKMKRKEREGEKKKYR